MKRKKRKGWNGMDEDKARERKGKKERGRL